MDAEMEGVDSLHIELDRIDNEWAPRRAIVYLIGTGVEHGPYIEFGTAPHAITANDADVLHFWVDGIEVFANTVDHPGTDAQPFLRPALDATRAELKTLAESSNSVQGFMRRAAEMVEQEAKQRAAVDTGELRASIRYERRR